MAYLAYATLDHLPRDGLTESRLGPPTSSVHQENAPGTSLMVVIHQLRFPLPKLVSSWQKLTSTQAERHDVGWRAERTEGIKAAPPSMATQLFRTSALMERYWAQEQLSISLDICLAGCEGTP